MSDYSRELPKTREHRRQLVSRVLFGAAVLAAGVGLAALFRLQGPPAAPTERYQAVGDFNDEHIWFNTSQPLSLYDQYRGHIVVILFCRFENLAAVQDLSALRRLSEAYVDNPVGVVVVYRTQTTDLETLHSHVRSWSLEFPVVVDDTGQVSENFGITAYPAVVVLGTHKRVSARFYAGWQEADLQGIVADLLGEGTASDNLAREPFVPDGGEYVPSRLRDI